MRLTAASAELCDPTSLYLSSAEFDVSQFPGASQSWLRIKSKRFHIKTLFKMTDVQQLEGDIYLSVYVFIYLKHTAAPFAQQRLLIMPKLVYSPVGIRPSIKEVQAIYI